MSPSDTPVGVVIAGGASSRMGEDKALLELRGIPLVERAIATLRAACREVLVADGGRGLTEGPESIPDGPGAGPAAGILGAAEHFPGRALLVLACDLPLVPPSLLERIVAVEGADWVVPRRKGRLEPLCALYRPAALRVLASGVSRGVLAPHRLGEVDALDIEYLDEPLLAEHGDPERMFTNLNTRRDVLRAERWMTDRQG